MARITGNIRYRDGNLDRISDFTGYVKKTLIQLADLVIFSVHRMTFPNRNNEKPAVICCINIFFLYVYVYICKQTHCLYKSFCACLDMLKFAS